MSATTTVSENTIPGRLAQEMTRLGLSNRDLAEAIKCPVSIVGIYKSRVDIPGKYSAGLKRLGINLDYLFIGEDQPTDTADATAASFNVSLQVALQEAQQAKQQADYWKQRAAAAEAHMYAVDIRIAAKELHPHTEYHATPWSELSDDERSHIERIAGAMMIAVNRERAERQKQSSQRNSA